MDTDISYSSKIRKLLQKNTLMSFKQLRLELGNRPRSSLYRDLQKLDLITSYSHAGQYHALKSAAQFDVDGLWFVDQAGFAKAGTLKNTLLQMIASAPAGMTQKELKSLLRIKVQNALTHLFKLNKVERQCLPDDVFVYLNVDPQRAEQQWQRRLTLHDHAPNVILPAEHLIIEILLELIRLSGSQTEIEVLGSHLRKRGIIIDDASIIYVLAYFDLKKN